MINAGTSTKPAAVASTLVVSQDAATIQQLKESLAQFAIVAEVASEITAAFQLLNRRHFEAVIVDMQIGERARELIAQVRSSASSQTAATFAVTAGGAETGVAFGAGSHFVLERPLSPESVHSNLKVAYGMIMRERRRYFRCPVVIPVVLRAHEGGELHCKSLNISESGMAVTSPVALKPDSQVSVAFSLPDDPTKFASEANVCWSDGSGRMGLQLVSLVSLHKEQLQAWLARRLEENLPDNVASQFQRNPES
jgi:DNA-binding response OmpR family regulator